MWFRFKASSSQSLGQIHLPEEQVGAQQPPRISSNSCISGCSAAFGLWKTFKVDSLSTLEALEDLTHQQKMITINDHNFE